MNILHGKLHKNADNECSAITLLKLENDWFYDLQN